MKRIFLSLLTGTLIGAAGVLFWHQSVSAETEAALKSENEAKIAQMQRELTSARNEASTCQQRMEAAGVDESPVKENVLDIQRIINDSRKACPFNTSFNTSDCLVMITETGLRGPIHLTSIRS